MHKCKKFKQVQVQLDYGKSEPKNISSSKSSTLVTTCSSSQRYNDQFKSSKYKYNYTEVNDIQSQLKCPLHKIQLKFTLG